MPRLDYAFCRACERHRDDCGLLSRHRLCAECAEQRLVENIVGLKYKRGEPLTRWRRGMILSAGGILPDNL